MSCGTRRTCSRSIRTTPRSAASATASAVRLPFDTIMRDWYSGDRMVFNNSGTYRKTSASTTTLELTFNNTGTIDVQAGRLQ